jgi:hypothetical protein
MSFKDAIAALNELQKRQIIADYAICGGCAVGYYFQFTDIKDMDIIVSVTSPKEFLELHDYFKRCNYFVVHLAPPRKGVKIENIVLFGRELALRLGRDYIDDLPVHLIPGYTCGLFKEAVSNAHRITIEGLPVKVINIEYLAAMLLKAFRQKDKKRIIELLEKTDIETLNEILLKHDNQEDSLKDKLEKILKTSFHS